NLRIEKIAEAEPPVSTISELKELVEEYAETGDISSDEAVHVLNLHLTVLEVFEKTGKNEKAVKHLNGLKDLLNHQKAEEQISEEAYETLIEGADASIDGLEKKNDSRINEKINQGVQIFNVNANTPKNKKGEEKSMKHKKQLSVG